VTSWSLQFEANNEDCCQMMMCCYPTMPILTLLPTLLNPLRNWTLRYWSISCVVLTLTFQTITCLIRFNKPCHRAATEGNCACVLVSQPKAFYSEGMKKIVWHWKVMYLSKLYCCFNKC
jgi:hypothetical protein